ncbi:MAG: 4Fe-4S binding protein [Prolixibacteraceae bacterium]|jgi:ferredoxin-type protein NapH|nr:4Fe-4S binding protein [Prolixibacteraceae bacterium]
MKSIRSYNLSLSVFVFVTFMLSMVQLKVETPMLLLERFIVGGGWFEIALVALFGAILAFKMQDPKQSGKWRRISWSIFSVWFFTQLLLGILIDDTFLLTGKLHLPVPAMIISGPIYRGEKSIMTLLFLSTIVLTGPAWCSQLCYFGAIDNLMAKGKTSRKKINYKNPVKNILLLSIIVVTIALRFFNVSPLNATIVGGVLGLVGLAIIAFYSRKQNRMVHCSVFCPIGTVVNYLKFINPFRMYIDSNCDSCLACTSNCKYDALTISDIQNRKTGHGCTFCGDCISSCKTNSIKYKFFGFSSNNARNLYLFLTISLYSIFLAMGRI